MEDIPSQQVTAMRGVVIFDEKGTIIRSSLNASVPRSLIKSLLASFKIPRSRVPDQLFQCYFEGENFRCLPVNSNIIVGWSRSSRFTLNRTKAGLVIVFDDPQGPQSTIRSSQDYSDHLNGVQILETELLAGEFMDI
ncbi:hypothetical protein Ahia01_000026200 [Argonauta hians]